MASISEILIEQGRVLADQRRRSGERRGALITGLGQIPVQVIADRQAARVAAQQAAERQAAAEEAAALKRSAEARANADLELRQNADARAQGTVDQARLDEERGRQAVQGWMKQHAASLKPEESARMEAILQMPGGAKHLVESLMKAPEPFTLNPGDVRYDASGQEIASNPKPVEVPKVTYGAPQPAMVNGRRVLIRAGSDGSIQTVQGATPDVPPTSTRDNEPLVAVMGDNGVPVLMRRSQAEGRRPASTREQGRAVTDGTAADLADFDTSLDDLKVLRDTVAPVDPKTGLPKEGGATGTSAKIGAMLPNAVTDLTGWGTEAKQKQAVIDRVKQVIGKTLEGGVLRKEDEAKYEKILPTIADTAAVVRKKLDGLEKAIALRKSRRLDALADAGYDVERYRSRTGPTTPSAPAAADPLGIR